MCTGSGSAERGGYQRVRALPTERQRPDTRPRTQPRWGGTFVDGMRGRTRRVRRSVRAHLHSDGLACSHVHVRVRQAHRCARRGTDANGAAKKSAAASRMLRLRSLGSRSSVCAISTETMKDTKERAKVERPRPRRVKCVGNISAL
eukprot:6207031-Pleurochrysis_carterae.AAC.3